MLRAVIDTNVLASWLMSTQGTMQVLRDAWEAGRFTMLTNDALLTELNDVLKRPNLQRFLPKQEAVDRFLVNVARHAERVECERPFPSSPDPGDDFLLALSRDGNADVLVTGDKALQRLGTFESTRILSPAAFCEELAGS